MSKCLKIRGRNEKVCTGLSEGAQDLAHGVTCDVPGPAGCSAAGLTVRPYSVVGRWTSIIWIVLISLIQRAESGPEPVCGVGGAKSHASSYAFDLELFGAI
jgi:hypothetical protein